ncbi:phosphoglycerate kinase [Candidatus Peregrinibacteria bacterium]|nr:phosphoglycerate kinase [Candidatus Peregrinibacteria bacterium]MBI3816747.1 phosphoglycerate kinase [Candidatus Peregrinibacteria bacterium]
MVKCCTLADADLRGKRVLLRAGFDVTIEKGKVMDLERIEALVPTMKRILKDGSLIILSHQGRPKGKKLAEFSQKPIVPVLEKLLKRPVRFVESCTGAVTEKMAKMLKKREVLLLENLRFDPGEEKNDPAFAKKLASLGDVYVNDAFPNCHRAHASMVALGKLLPAFMGLQLQKEVQELSRVTEHPKHPLVLIISGAKLETKIPVIQRFLAKGDDILLGGCIANTFIAARGFDVGNSKYEEQYIEQAMEFMLEAEKKNQADLHVPRDVVLASEATEGASKIDLPVEDIEGDMSIFDIGKVTIERYCRVIEKAKMIVWNGPLGLYEINRFSHATKRIAEAVAAATKRGAISIIGGGDTLDFHVRYRYPLDVYSFVSTGGGAMLEFIAGKPLLALQVLRK